MNREFDQNSDSQEIRISSQADGFMRVGMKDTKLTSLFTGDENKGIRHESFRKEIRRLLRIMDSK
jgi:hypothetical protein